MDNRLTPQIYQEVLVLTPEIIKNYVGLDGLRTSFYEHIEKEFTVADIEKFHAQLNQAFIYDHKDYGNIIEALESLVKSEEFLVVQDISELVDVALFIKGLKEAQSFLNNTVAYISKHKENLSASLKEAFTVHQSDIFHKTMMGSDVLNNNELDDLSTKLIQGVYSVESATDYIRQKFLELGRAKVRPYQEYSLVKFQRFYDPQKSNKSEIVDTVLYMADTTNHGKSA